MQWYYHTGTTYDPSLLTTAPQIADGSLTSWVSNDYTRPVGATSIQVVVWGVAVCDTTDTFGTAVTFSWDSTNYPCSINDTKWNLFYTTAQGSAGFVQATGGWTLYKIGGLGQIPTGVFTTAIPAVGNGSTAARSWRVQILALTDDPSCPGWTTPAQGVAQARLYDLLPVFTAGSCVTPGTAINLSAGLSCCGGNANLAWSGAQSALTYSVYELVPGLAPAYALIGTTAGTAFTATLTALEKTNQHIFKVVATNACGDGVGTAVTVGPKFVATTCSLNTFTAATDTCNTYTAATRATPTYAVPTCTN